MDHGVQLLKTCTPRRLSGYFDASLQHTQTMQSPSTWATTLLNLRNQKAYLHDLLSKAATTLNALRDKQSRNDRVLSTNPGPRSKKKKMVQNRWRTDKTIKTCEKEERVILDCLQVCENNIWTLEALLHSMGTCRTAAEYTSCDSRCSYTDSTRTDFNWNGWAGQGPTFLFHWKRKGTLVDEIPPEACIDGIATRLDHAVPILAPANQCPSPLLPSTRVTPSSMPPPLPPALPKTACPHFRTRLSPEAACFEPRFVNVPRVENQVKELDKFSISGPLASRRMSHIRGRRFSEAVIGHGRLSSTARPVLGDARACKSWGPDSRQYRNSLPHEATAELITRSF
ncbi:hypothetical protein K504DRAFT_451500 [Pleomassaria siparia CBS 279.74]|uniref:Uncharacterized protein n=1 Tax=Pleomassaria siparia CBS 279.74 TaxID=1314801 RepID=A0A6G1JSW9_9PLEO|nr:hypothetical protein K504DRAFT_451500 [Pleomassaria siparia CBS 279.74]